MDYKDAIKIIRKEIRKNKGLYYAWQSNIAMSFMDEVERNGYKFPCLHEICNRAAKSFLNNLLKKH